MSIDSGFVWSTTCESSLRPRVINRCRNTLRIDERPRCHLLDVFQAHSLLHGTAELQEAFADFVSSQLVDGTQTPVAEVIDIVDVGRRIVRPQADDVLIALTSAVLASFLSSATSCVLVDAETANNAKPVSIQIKETIAEQVDSLVRQGGLPGRSRW